MTTRIIFIFLFSFITSFQSFAQESKFVEVVCTGSYTLQPTSFVYQISLGQQMNFMGIALPSDDEESDAEIPLISDIETILKHGNFVFTKVEDGDYSVSVNENKPVLQVQLANKKELKRLYDTLKVEEGISGKVIDMTYEPFTAKYNTMFELLYTDAQLQATLLAKTTGNTIGQLLSVSELKEEGNSYMDMYKDMMEGMDISFFTNNSKSLDQKVERKFRFKFELR